jgi:hypothetical protein
MLRSPDDNWAAVEHTGTRLRSFSAPSLLGGPDARIVPHWLPLPSVTVTAAKMYCCRIRREWPPRARTGDS